MSPVKTMRAQVVACALCGVETIPVTVEISVGSGLPGAHIVGMGDAAVQEAKRRVRSALRASGFEVPTRYVLINLAPADVRKSGTAFDLPIAVAYLLATEQIDPACVENTLIVGELALEGSVRAVKGLFAHALCAERCGRILVSGQPKTRSPQIPGLEHRCLEHLSQLRTGSFSRPQAFRVRSQAKKLDYADVVGQDAAIRALTIAAAGGHGMMLVGPPGAGKSMLAQRMPTILPPLTEDERMEVALIHSVVGLDLEPIAQGERPFRAPHHSATMAALVGGGRVPMPGEASLAHRGVLFLDELGEFSSQTLQALRQPIEDGFVTLSRAQWRAVFPACFQLLAASNPCPCGYLGDRTRSCKCSEQQVNKYQSKLGGPLKDRIDLICEVGRVDPAKVLDSGRGVSSAELRSQVCAARERKEARGAQAAFSATLPSEVIAECNMKPQQKLLLEEMALARDLSGRAIVRILHVARTIADLAESDTVADEHLYEAFMYRVENTLE